MTTNRVSRRAALTMLSFTAVYLAACGGPSVPTSFVPLGWDYLPRLKLNVAVIDIDDSWKPRGAQEKGFLAPTPPLDALRKMAEDRLVAAGMSGRAVFVIEDASIAQSRGAYVGSFAVRLDVSTSDGTRSGYAEARVVRRRAMNDDSPDGVRAGLYDIVKQMMSDMNVELEYQIRRSLRDYLQTTEPAAPEPAPVEHEDLAPPTSTPAIPAAPFAPPRPSAVPFSSPAPTPLVR
jgi:hypothetical protein